VFLVLHSSLGWAEDPEQPIAKVAAQAKLMTAPITEVTNEGQQAAGFPTPIAAEGMRVYRDPKPGRLGAPAPGIQPPGLSAAEQLLTD